MKEVNTEQFKKFYFMIFLMLSTASCGGGHGGGSRGRSSSPVTSSVLELNCSVVAESGLVFIQAGAFSPAIETISAGGIVKWINNDIKTHTVTAIGKLFDISLAPSADLCLQFNGFGTFDYYDKFDLSLTGKVIAN